MWGPDQDCERELPGLHFPVKMALTLRQSAALKVWRSLQLASMPAEGYAAPLLSLLGR